MRSLIPTRQLLAFGLIIALVIGIAIFALVELRAALTAQVHGSDQAVAALSARILQERLNRLVDLNVSLATRVQFREEVEKKLWPEATARMAGVPHDFTFVEGVFLLDAPGVLRGAVPEISEFYGKDFSYREYYQGVRKAGAPYVSDVFKRVASPQLNIIVSVVPVFSTTDPTRVNAYLGIQVRLDTLLAWANEIDYGQDAYAIFVDRKGTPAVSQKLTQEGPIASYADVPWVKAALAGQSGITTAPDPVSDEEQLIAYEPVRQYGWGVGVSRPTATAFAIRDRTLATAGAVSVVIIDLTIIIVIAVVRSFSRLQQTKIEFVSAATHQLKTPLAGLRWTLESLQIPDAVLTDQQRSYMRNLQQYGERLVQSVDGLLDLSRLELGTVMTHIEDTDLRQFLEGVRSDLDRYATTYKHTVYLEIEPDVPTTLAMERQLVYHVLQNLLANAVEYAKPDTPVTLKCERAADSIRLSVHNIGDPIPEDVQKRLFEKFYRAPSARDKKANGTGVGLYIARGFTKQWGGRIGLNAVANDITFWVTIPVPKTKTST